MWEQGHPDHPGLDEWRRRVRPPSFWQRLTQRR
jgi:hypothetical protein